MTRFYTFLAVVICLCLSTPSQGQIFDNFETINSVAPNPFAIGTAPESATFSGDAFSGVAGIPELYFSGSHAWMVNPGGTGVIQFDSNASSVNFWTRLRSGANGSSVYTAFNDLNGVISTTTISNPGVFQQLFFTGNIDRIEVVNNATGNLQMNSIDDFTFTSISTAVPEPSSAIPLAVGYIFVSLRRKRERQRTSRRG